MDAFSHAEETGGRRIWQASGEGRRATCYAIGVGGAFDGARKIERCFERANKRWSLVGSLAARAASRECGQHEAVGRGRRWTGPDVDER